jgi:hypothetical protein
VTRIGPVLAILCSGIAWGASPSYSAAGIVSTGSYAPGPFAPNSLITIFGSGLAMGPRGVTAAAPALFVEGGYAIATHADNSLLTAEKPARPGELIVVYAAGLGKTATTPGNGELVPYLSALADLTGFRATLGGAAVAAGKIYYAGLTPQSAGLYQVNFWVPDQVGNDPEVRLFVGDAGSPAGVKLRVLGSSGQLSAADGR